jgi:hypothetical protein
MSKARDLANAGTALTTVSATELGYLDGVTSAVQTQINAKEATLPSQTGNSGKYLTTDGTNKSWGTVSQYALPSQTGNSGKYLTTNGTSESWGTVTTPIKWTSRGGFGTQSNSIAYNGSNLYVAVGSGGTIQTSPDGITWTSRTSNTANVLTKVAFGNGIWVAVGYSGTLVSSTDGTTWTVRTSNMGVNDIYGLAFGNGIFVGVGTGGGTTNTGGIIYSTDGITWTRKSQSLTVGSTYLCAVWNGNNWIVGGGFSTNNHLYASTPSGTWTVGNSNNGSRDINFLFYDGTRTIEIVDDGTVRFSTSSTLGTTTALSGVTVYPQTIKTTVAYHNGRIASTGLGFTEFSTTPLTGNYVNITAPMSVSPTTKFLSTGGFSEGSGSIFAGAAGYILIGGNPGPIFTSF